MSRVFLKKYRKTFFLQKQDEKVESQTKKSPDFRKTKECIFSLLCFLVDKREFFNITEKCKQLLSKNAIFAYEI